MSYKFVDSFLAGPGWSCSKAVYKPVGHISVPSVQWINSWWWAEELPETRRVSCRSKFGKLVHLLGFIIKKFVMMRCHMNVKNHYCSFISLILDSLVSAQYVGLFTQISLPFREDKWLNWGSRTTYSCTVWSNCNGIVYIKQTAKINNFKNENIKWQQWNLRRILRLSYVKMGCFKTSVTVSWIHC